MSALLTIALIHLLAVMSPGPDFALCTRNSLINIIKFLGAGYLLFIGWKALMHKSAVPSLHDAPILQHADLSPFKSVWMGFLCNTLNPKATLFFLALFTQVIHPGTPLAIQLLYGVVMSLQTFVWFTVVASIFSLNALKRRFERIQSIVERSMGAILIALGLRVALASRE